MPAAKWSLLLWPRHSRLKCWCTFRCTFGQGNMAIYGGTTTQGLQWGMLLSAGVKVMEHWQYFPSANFWAEFWLLSMFSWFWIHWQVQNSWSWSRRQEQQLHRKHKACIGIERKKYLCCARHRTLLGIQRVTCGNARKRKDTYLAF